MNSAGTTVERADAPADVAQRSIGIGKDLLALLRDLVLVVVFVLLLLRPDFVGERLSRAGFEEGSMMGFTWKRKAQNIGHEAIALKQELESAKRQLQLQAAQLQRNQTELAALRTGAESPQQARRLDDLMAQNRSLRTDAQAAAVGIADRLRASQPAIMEAREATGTTPDWAVVMGADRTLDAARYEARIASLRGLQNVGIYRRGGSYRTIALAATKEAAKKMQSVARRRSPDAYVVRFSSWCPRREPQDGYTACAAS